LTQGYLVSITKQVPYDSCTAYLLANVEEGTDLVMLWQIERPRDDRGRVSVVHEHAGRHHLVSQFAAGPNNGPQRRGKIVFMTTVDHAVVPELIFRTPQDRH